MSTRIPLLVAGLLFACTATAADWPQWRGPDRTAISSETGLLKAWPKDGPPRTWTVSGLGDGHGAPTIADGKIFGMGTRGGKDGIWALKESDGSELWFTPFDDPRKTNQNNGPSGSTTFADGKLYTVSSNGKLACFSAANGKKVWGVDYVADFGGRVPSWGFTDSPLIDGEKLICVPTSAKAAVAALNKDSGKVIWKTEIAGGPGNGAGYASPIKATLGEVPMYITLLGKSGGVVAVHADTGKLLWQYARIANGTADIPTVIVKDDLVWCSSGYGDGGSALLKMTAEGKDRVSVKELKYYDQSLQNHHGGMVLVGDYVYFGANHGQGYPACVEFKTGEKKYKMSKPIGGGGGSAAVAFADGMLYYRYQNGQVVLLNATPDEDEVKVAGSFKVPDQSRAAQWAHPVIANGMLYIRDQEKLHCYNVKADKN